MTILKRQPTQGRRGTKGHLNPFTERGFLRGLIMYQIITVVINDATERPSTHKGGSSLMHNPTNTFFIKERITKEIKKKERKKREQEKRGGKRRKKLLGYAR